MFIQPLVRHLESDAELLRTGFLRRCRGFPSFCVIATLVFAVLSPGLCATVVPAGRALSAVTRTAAYLQQAFPPVSDTRPPTELDTARKNLSEIFARREFRGLSGPSLWEQWKQRIERWLLTKLAALLRLLHVNGAVGSAFAWGVIALSFVLLAYSVWRNLARRTRKASMQIEPTSSPDQSRGWAEEALAAADRGDYREAIRCGYWAAVTRLEDVGILTYDRSHTPRELLRLLHSHPREQTWLSELTGRFEAVWYGYRPASAADWYSARAQLEQMACFKSSTAVTASS